MPTARVKRILANRQSAARSKERKLAYIGELESQVSACRAENHLAPMQSWDCMVLHESGARTHAAECHGYCERCEDWVSGEADGVQVGGCRCRR